MNEKSDEKEQQIKALEAEIVELEKKVELAKLELSTAKKKLEIISK